MNFSDSFFFLLQCSITLRDLGFNASFASDGSEGKASARNAGDLDSISGWGRSTGEGNGNPLQHSCLENPMDREAWQATVHGVAKSWTRLSYFTFTFTLTHSLMLYTGDMDRETLKEVSLTAFGLLSTDQQY